ncbi:MAG: DUF4440 domain-containing protein [Gammaproteobacteria bacterium]
MEDIDRLIARFFGAFDNCNGRVPAYADIAALFIEGAVILYKAEPGTSILTVDEFSEPRVALLASGNLIDFHEWETTSTTKIFGEFAIRTSNYSKQGMLDSHPYEGHGVKLFQLANMDGGWRIASLCWYDSNGEQA